MMFSANAAPDALALLTALGGPDSTKAVLNDLIAREAAIKKQRADIDNRADLLNALTTDLTARENQLTLERSAFDTKHAATESSLLTRGADLAAKTAAFEADTETQRNALAAAAASVKDRENAVAITGSGLAAREAAVKAREDAIAPLEAAAAATKAEYEDKLAKLKAITG